MASGMDLWVLVVDGARARLLRRGADAPRLAVVWEEASAEAREKASQLVTDRPGRAFESGTSERRSAMAPRTDPKRHTKDLFAAHVAERLERELPATARLVVIAAPATLGALRAQLAPELQRRVVRQIDKDLTAATPEEIAAHLGPLPPAPR